MKKYQSLQIILILLVFLPAMLILQTGCSKDGGSGKNYNIIDKNYFFTVNIGGKSYTSYGWFQSDYSDVWNGAPYIFTSFDIDPLNGDTTWTRNITVIDYVTNNASPKSVGNCNASFKLTKKGTNMGTYTVVKGPRADNKFYDLDGKSYFIDQEGEQFNITNRSPVGASKPYVEGNFQCNLWEVNGSTTTRIPATGTFRLEGY
jgi:hypothetical protein